LANIAGARRSWPQHCRHNSCHHNPSHRNPPWTTVRGCHRSSKCSRSPRPESATACHMKWLYYFQQISRAQNSACEDYVGQRLLHFVHCPGSVLNRSFTLLYSTVALVALTGRKKECTPPPSRAHCCSSTQAMWLCAQSTHEWPLTDRWVLDGSWTPGKSKLCTSKCNH
jgi:hypothetical protein